MSYPKTITAEWIAEELKRGNFPDMYPDQEFLAEHYKIIEPYEGYISAYKGICYKELNTYYKSGEIILQGCNTDLIPGTGTPIEKLKEAADKLEELYDKVKPLDHDILVYRGVKTGTIGQNLYTGDCVKTRLYALQKHRFCTDPDLVDITLFDPQNPKASVYETLGFTSVGTDIDIALAFADAPPEWDTVMALRLPAGTKFIMPLTNLFGKYIDREQEFILFPQHNTFVLANTITVQKSSQSFTVYIGAFCDNIERPGPPKVRPLRTKTLAYHKWLYDVQKEHPALAYEDTIGKCDYDKAYLCHKVIHFCDPESGKCIADTEENRQKILDWWKNASIKGKCWASKASKCIADKRVCNPDTGVCDLPDYVSHALAKFPAGKTAYTTSIEKITENDDEEDEDEDENEEDENNYENDEKEDEHEDEEDEEEEFVDEDGNIISPDELGSYEIIKNYEQMTQKELKNELGKRGIAKHGNKIPMIARLHKNDTFQKKFAGVDLNMLSMDQLKSLATELQIVGRAWQRKDALINMINRTLGK